MLAYFSLSVPAGLGVYWVTNNLLSTLTTVSIKAYFKQNPVDGQADLDLDALAAKAGLTEAINKAGSGLLTEWGYSCEEDMYAEARENYRPPRRPFVPASFSP